MEWLSFFGHRRPINGQAIWYYGEAIGVWRGTYRLNWNDPVSPHVIVCGERDDETDQVLSEFGLAGIEMSVDRNDAPWWQPDEGQPRPEKPSDPYPSDYMKGHDR